MENVETDRWMDREMDEQTMITIAHGADGQMGKHCLYLN